MPRCLDTCSLLACYVQQGLKQQPLRCRRQCGYQRPRRHVTQGAIEHVCDASSRGAVDELLQHSCCQHLYDSILPEGAIERALACISQPGCALTQAGPVRPRWLHAKLSAASSAYAEDVISVTNGTRRCSPHVSAPCMALAKRLGKLTRSLATCAGRSTCTCNTMDERT